MSDKKSVYFKGNEEDSYEIWCGECNRQIKSGWASGKWTAHVSIPMIVNLREKHKC